MSGRLFPLKSWASLSIPQGCRRVTLALTADRTDDWRIRQRALN
jgi:hypothetical protein